MGMNNNQINHIIKYEFTKTNGVLFIIAILLCGSVYNDIQSEREEIQRQCDYHAISIADPDIHIEGQEICLTPRYKKKG